MDRIEKIEFLRGLADGTTSIDQIITEEKNTDRQNELLNERATTPELNRILRNFKTYGNYDEWPENEILFSENLLNDLENRIEISSIPFWCSPNGPGSGCLPGELISITYQDKAKVFEMMTIGWNQEDNPHVIFPDYNEYFEFDDLATMFPGVSFHRMLPPQLEEIAAILIKKNLNRK